MARYYGPKVRLSRSVQAAIAETSKHVTPKKQSRPGVHVTRQAPSRMRGLRERVRGRLVDGNLRQRLGGPVLGEA